MNYQLPTDKLNLQNASRPGPQPQRQGPPPQNRGQSPFPPPGYPQQPQFGGYYPPQQYGRGYGPPPGNFGPGPGFNMPYGPPPPGYFGPGGQHFPQGPNMHSQPQMPIGPPGQRPPGQPSQQHPSPPSHMQPPKPTSELPVNDKAVSKATSKGSTPAPPQNVPTPPVDPKLPVSEALAPSPQPTDEQPSLAGTAAKAIPSGPKSTRVAPAVPFTVNQKTFVPPVPSTSNGPLASAGNTPQQTSKPAPSAAAMEEASRQAKEAVAAAMAKLNPQASQPKPPANPKAMDKATVNSNTVDTLTKKVGEMRTSDGNVRGPRGSARGARGNYRGGPGGQARKMEIPKSDYDFESANAKFNKEDMIKEAIATGSPLAETSGSTTDGIDGAPTSATTNGEGRKDSLSNVSATPAYNKSSSFFDNLSSEIKDREEERAQPRGRGWRGEEIKKNFETFGQGSVDGGGFRGRGRGFRGRGRPYGGHNRGFAGRGGGYGGGPRGQGGNGQEFSQS
jgi:protein LSM14